MAYSCAYVTSDSSSWGKCERWCVCSDHAVQTVLNGLDGHGRLLFKLIMRVRCILCSFHQGWNLPTRPNHHINITVRVLLCGEANVLFQRIHAHIPRDKCAAKVAGELALEVLLTVYFRPFYLLLKSLVCTGLRFHPPRALLLKVVKS